MADDCKYALVMQVLVEKVTSTELTFATRSSADELERFTVPLTEVLQGPPTHAPTPVTLVKGAIGNLYLSEDGWKARAPHTSSTLYKAGDINLVLFKWPRCTPYRTLDRLSVKPTAVEVDGHVHGTTTPFTIDLLGAEAAQVQAIDWRAAGPITIELTQDAAVARNLETTVHVWPKRLHVTGTPAHFQGTSATVDVLDVFFADFNQKFGWTTPGSTIELTLSQEGFDPFGLVAPTLVHYARGFAVSYPDAVFAEWEKVKPKNPKILELAKRARQRAKVRLPRRSDA